MEIAAKKRRRRGIWLGALGAVAIAGFVFGAPIVNALVDAWHAGFFEKGPAKHAYGGTSLDNLRALYQATQLYYDANEAMPGAATWMDDLKIYIHTNDLKTGEEMKKFVNPRLPAGDGVFGYAFNSALGGAFKENIKDPSHTVLIFECKDTKWNASGDPAKLRPDPELEGGDFAVTVDGNVVPLRDLLDKNSP